MARDQHRDDFQYPKLMMDRFIHQAQTDKDNVLTIGMDTMDGTTTILPWLKRRSKDMQANVLPLFQLILQLSFCSSA